MRPLPRRALACLCLLLAPVAHATAQEAKQTPPNAAPPKPYTGISDLTVSPAELPVPVLRYRFLPEVGELNPGDAAPVYLRLAHETPSEGINNLSNQASKWTNLPPNQFPVKEAEALVRDWSPRVRQIEFGTRRATCRWEYTVREEADHAFEILLPDAQGMRHWGRLLALKARVEVARGQLDQAIGTIETGIAFGRHVAEGPFTINKLIGIAITNTMVAELDELIDRPDAPNLYWALTTLPRPLVDMRGASEMERLSVGTTMTGAPLTSFDPKKARTDADWAALLADLHARMVTQHDAMTRPEEKAVAMLDLEQFRRSMLAPSREYLKARGIEARTDDQAVALAMMGLYREFLDEATKRDYLPYAEAAKLPPVVEAEKVKAGPAAMLFQFLPATEAAGVAAVRLDRKVAALRAVEALRLYAARHDGQFPDRLDQVKEVPIPLDPASGTPFEYRRDGAKATLASPTPLTGTKITYNLTLRP